MPQEEVMNICNKPQGQHGNVQGNNNCFYHNEAYGVDYNLCWDCNGKGIKKLCPFIFTQKLFLFLFYYYYLLFLSYYYFYCYYIFFGNNLWIKIIGQNKFFQWKRFN